MVAFVVFFGNKVIEKVISAWSIVFYATYGSMFALVVWKFGPQLHAALRATPLDWAEALRDSFSYLGYNVVILPILMFVARNFQSRPEALAAGALAGPLILLPGLASLLRFVGLLSGDSDRTAADFRGAGASREPCAPVCVELVILGAFVKTGVGLLHGLNERFARAAVDAAGPCRAC